MITAHGGALNTGRNTYEYFKAMENLGMEAIEVDIRSKKGELYLGHLHVPFFKSKSPSVKVVPVGIPDRYISQGTQEELREECGLSKDRIKDTISCELQIFSKKD